jgi:hypothetical protein
MAAGLFLTNWNRLGGSGTDIWLRGRNVGGGIAIAGPATPHAAPPGNSGPAAISMIQSTVMVEVAIPLLFMEMLLVVTLRDLWILGGLA